MSTSIQKHLLSLKDEEYLAFNYSLCNTCKKPMIGVRLPLLREYAKELSQSAKEVTFVDEYFEEIMIHGLYIAYKKDDFNAKCKKIDEFIPLIDNWSVCDSFVTSLKFIKKNKEEYKPKINKYLKSKKEYYQRYGLVVLLHYYVDEEHIDYVFEVLKTVKYNGYYSLMGAAWLLSWCFIYDFNKTLKFIKQNKLNDFVYKKGIQKTLESFRVSDKDKATLRKLSKQV